MDRYSEKVSTSIFINYSKNPLASFSLLLLLPLFTPLLPFRTVPFPTHFSPTSLCQNSNSSLRGRKSPSSLSIVIFDVAAFS